MAGLNLYVYLKLVGILLGALCGVLGTLTKTHQETLTGRKVTIWGWINVGIIIICVGLAGISQVLDTKRQYKESEERKKSDAQKDLAYQEQLNRILAGQNASIQKQAQANVALKMKLMEPDTENWLADSNSIQKKRITLAKAEAERIANETEEASRKSNQVYEDILFAVEFTKKRVLEIQKTTGEDIEIPSTKFPENLSSEPFECLIKFKRSNAFWKIHIRKDGNDGFPWLQMEFFDYNGTQTSTINSLTKPIKDWFDISYWEGRDSKIDETGKLADYQAVARKVIEHAIQAQYVLTAPLPTNLK